MKPTWKTIATTGTVAVACMAFNGDRCTHKDFPLATRAPEGPSA